MKKIVVIVAMMASVMGLKAQNCELIVLPFFGGNHEAMDAYPQEKFEWRCAFARAAFYVSDTVPTGAEVYSITEVMDLESGEYLPVNYRVNLDELSFYAYDFHDFQLRYPLGNVTIYFTTPASEHRYLVLRSIDDTYAFAEKLINKE